VFGFSPLVSQRLSIPMNLPTRNGNPKGHNLFSALALLLLTASVILIHGYHLGVEDQTIYLPAIKKILDPSLYPRDAEFFLAQTRPTVFPQIVAATVRISRGSIESVMLAWQLFSIFLILAGTLR